MTPPVIDTLTGLEILDSRGQPTVSATCVLRGGAAGTASVPAGRSTGAAEAIERRDGDPGRYRGAGCRQAAASIGNEIGQALAGRAFAGQHDLDAALTGLDGTQGKSRLGANALLAVSLAFARAVAAQHGLPLYRHLAQAAGAVPAALPRPFINLFSGGLHAGGQIELQDVMIVPARARTMDEALAVAFEVYRAAAAHTQAAYGARLLRADEGGLAPPFPGIRAMLADAVTAIGAAGLTPGTDVALAIDVAASHFTEGPGRYQLAGEVLDAAAMVSEISGWQRDYPIISVEDGLAEDDWQGWPLLAAGLRGRSLVIGDDLLCTSPERIRRAAALGAADTLLLKPNQAGTVTEAAAAGEAARTAGWRVMASARSGETEDAWLADLAVAWSADYIKIGSITQSDRLAKYNRLLAIGAETGWPLTDMPLRP